MLSDAELSRYARQLPLPGWGAEGQRRLKNARIVVAGAGGLGSSVLTYLAAAGVGYIRIVDSDSVELGNLNRQTLYTSGDIGKLKAPAARDRLALLNPDIEIAALTQSITSESVSHLVEGCHLIVDALDNLPTRLLLNEVAVRRTLPLFHGAVYGFQGSATTLLPPQTPCLRCLYQGVVPGKVPVVGVAPAVIGCVQATEVLKFVLGIGDLLAGRLLMYDGLGMRFSEVKVKKDPDCQACGPHRPLEAEPRQ
jgi:adenylyltransferase/sulfurtransferase